MNTLGKRVLSAESGIKQGCSGLLLWLSPSDMKNAILDNLLVDYLNRFGTEKGFVRDDGNFNHELFRLGNTFESKVMENIRGKVGEIKEIATGRCYDKWGETVSALKAGCPIIYQGPLISESRGLRGIPDLLVRVDYVNRLFKQRVIEDGDISKGGYVVIDIKFSTLPVMKNSMILRSEVKTKFYKSQLWVYNEMLKEALGKGFDYAFILGRGIEGRSEFCDEMPGKVIFSPEFGNDMLQIIEKKRLFEENINRIKIGDAIILPNMKIPEQYNEGWSMAKKEIAEEFGEITLLPGCGVIHRERARSAGVLNIWDPHCNSISLGINGPIMAELVDRVAWINRCTGQIIHPLSLEKNLVWRKKEGIDLFVDFETVGDLCLEKFETLPQSQKGSMVFLIGVGWYMQEKWNFRKFIVRELSFEEEKHMFYRFAMFVNGMKILHGGTRIFHWGHIEQSCFAKVKEKYRIRLTCPWIDMCKELKSIPVVINGAYGFGLKEFARAMYQHSLIDVKWTGEVGFQEIITRMIGKWGAKIDEKEYADMIQYNEEDCRIMGEITRYFREYH